MIKEEEYKKGLCPNCRYQIKIPTNQCVTRCKNCRNIVVFICHVVRGENQPKLRIKCHVCNKFNTLVTCPSCKGYAVIENFMCGLTYKCGCGYEGTLVICFACRRILSLPPHKNYENTVIACRECQNQFKYKICGSCGADMYKKGADQNQQYKCPNPQCKSHTPKLVNPYIKQSKLKESQIANVQKTLSKFINDEQTLHTEICKMCFSERSNMVNLKCFHLSICEKCSKKINQCCPICRTIGEYKKVYMS